MQKLIALALSLVMALSLVACGEKPVYKTGLGVITTATTTDPTEEKAGKVQINTNMAVATFDKDGKVVSVTFDVAQQSANVTAEGKIDGEIDLRTKVEKGPDYRMQGVSGIGKEIDEQYAALEDWMKGKTVDEIMAVETYEKDDHHTRVPKEGTDLAAGVTIDIGSALDCVKKAYDNATETVGVPEKTGLGVSIEESHKDAEADAEGSVQITTTIIGAAFDKDGKVVALHTDAAQQKAKFDAKGMFQGEIDLRTKVEKGPDYGMKGVSPIGKELDEQYAAFEQYTIGKTADEITGMPVKTVGDHTNVPDVEDLAASVTISMTGHFEALTKAAANAK
jgi:roadblock/LC7 domain-containing protein